MNRALRAFLAALVAVAALALAPREARAEAGDELTVSVLTFGPGDHPFFKFGHNAILVHDDSRRDARADLVYNYGTFGFESWTLIPNFFRGKLQYWLSIQSLAGTKELYRQENRTVVQQVLNLTAAEKRAIAEDLRVNALPANKYYKYDYYQDNCSTRVRDVVDRATKGRVALASKGPASFTWRQHTLRLTADDLPVYLGLNAAMGDFIDQKGTVWDEMFLPSKVEETLRHVTVIGPDGVEAPLVKSEIELLAAPGRAPLRTAPPRWIPGFAIAGAVIGAALYGLFVASRKSRAARVGLGVTLATIGLVIGFLGCLFVMFWAFTDHRVAYHNENILQCAPWLIVLAGTGISFARGKLAASERVRKLLVAAAGASLLGLALKVVPWFDQQNGQIIALMLPIWLGAAAGAEVARRKSVADARPV